MQLQECSALHQWCCAMLCFLTPTPASASHAQEQQLGGQAAAEDGSGGKADTHANLNAWTQLTTVGGDGGSSSSAGSGSSGSGSADSGSSSGEGGAGGGAAQQQQQQQQEKQDTQAAVQREGGGAAGGGSQQGGSGLGAASGYVTVELKVPQVRADRCRCCLASARVCSFFGSSQIRRVVLADASLAAVPWLALSPTAESAIACPCDCSHAGIPRLPCLPTHHARWSLSPVRRLPQAPPSFNSWVHSEDMLLFHLRALQQQLEQVYVGMALAAAAGRAFVLPQVRCGAGRGGQAGQQGGRQG